MGDLRSMGGETLEEKERHGEENCRDGEQDEEGEAVVDHQLPLARLPLRFGRRHRSLPV